MGPQSFVDNLANLELVMSVALEHLLENRDDSRPSLQRYWGLFYVLASTRYLSAATQFMVP
jgi:hypothetical protein